ncbi:MarR family winged helix-turn-helix transcriptional regulator [Pseudosporangium ferrugineum]|uniref:MarR family winged helix-turn-helix transcriptional regulator n=1 Tax=Pseudosporangium ferrugineum TaxID=439699 RepID=UPI001304D89C|nr:MarR family transcriptional regulator [Pseudosporangium ferrugineum]
MRQNGELIDEIIVAGRQVRLALVEQLSQALYESGLTIAQLRILLLLRKLDVTHGRELVAILGVNAATLSGIIDRLVSAGLALRHEDHDDRRIRRISLSDKGEATLEHLLDGFGLDETSFLEDLSPAQLELMREAAHTIAQRLVTPDEASGQND